MSPLFCAVDVDLVIGVLYLVLPVILKISP